MSKTYPCQSRPLSEQCAGEHTCTTVHSERAVGVYAPLGVQVGGDHYKNLAIQPVVYIHKNGIGFCEYLIRWRSKGGVEDLKKARHFIDLLIELEEKR